MWCTILWFLIRTWRRLSFAIWFSANTCRQSKYFSLLTVPLSIWPLLVSIGRMLIVVRSMQITANWCPVKSQRDHKNRQIFPNHLSFNEIAQNTHRKKKKNSSIKCWKYFLINIRYTIHYDRPYGFTLLHTLRPLKIHWMWKTLNL